LTFGTPFLEAGVDHASSSSLIGVRHVKREELKRLKSKTLDAEFKTTIREGLNCSPFEAEAVLEVVHEVYDAALGVSETAVLPGRIALVAVEADEPAGKPSRWPSARRYSCTSGSRTSGPAWLSSSDACNGFDESTGHRPRVTFQPERLVWSVRDTAPVSPSRELFRPRRGRLAVRPAQRWQSGPLLRAKYLLCRRTSRPEHLSRLSSF
jgi:hypothetical protein